MQQEVLISEFFAKELSKRFGIRARHALEVLNSPDRTDTIEMEGLVLRIHTKQIDKAKPSFVLIVVESERDGKTFVDLALKAYADIAEGIEDMRPLAALRAIAERFGALIKIGDVEARFIERAQIPIRGTDDIRIMKSSESPYGSLIQEMYLRIDPGPPMIARCALCLCLKAVEYERWLHSIN